MNQACLGDVSSCEKQLLLLLYIIIIITTDTKHYTVCTIFTSVFQNSQNEEKKTITENRRRTKSREA